MNKPRSIFEDVGDEGPSRSAPPPVTARRSSAARGAIAMWLAILFALVVVMVVVGGMTRLTNSGLSIVDWRPVTGAVPPLSAEAWTAEFEKYKTSPQYALTNPDMTLAEFRGIYWWEWGHRQVGRVIGAVWAIGFLWFLLRGRIPTGWTPRLLALGVLGGLQGAIGWWMVSSGLTGTMVSVASTRLAVHLGLAFVILGLIAWYVLNLRRSEGDLLQARRQRNPALMRWGSALVVLVFAQVVLGALVAGIDAGRNYTDWPMMGGELFPSTAFNLEPFATNFIENPGLVQFMHRMLGYGVAVAVVLAWLRSRHSALASLRGSFDVVLAVTAVQIFVGIVTVLYAAPWQIAILHQLGAVVLFVVLLRARFAALYPMAQRIARGRP